MEVVVSLSSVRTPGLLPKRTAQAQQSENFSSTPVRKQGTKKRQTAKKFTSTLYYSPSSGDPSPVYLSLAYLSLVFLESLSIYVFILKQADLLSCREKLDSR